MKNKKGPCGGPNQPSCKEELIRMAKKQGFNKSYQKEMDVKDTGKMKQPAILKGGSMMGKHHVNNSARALTKKRIQGLVNHEGYAAFTKNPNAGGIIRHVNNFINSAKTTQRNQTRYQVPTVKEASSLINIGKKYTNSKNIEKDISFVDKAKVMAHGARLTFKYPNILSYGKSKVSKSKK